MPLAEFMVLSMWGPAFCPEALGKTRKIGGEHFDSFLKFPLFISFFCAEHPWVVFGIF